MRKKKKQLNSSSSGSSDSTKNMQKKKKKKLEKLNSHSHGLGDHDNPKKMVVDCSHADSGSRSSNLYTKMITDMISKEIDLLKK